MVKKMALGKYGSVRVEALAPETPTHWRRQLRRVSFFLNPDDAPLQANGIAYGYLQCVVISEVCGEGADQRTEPAHARVTHCTLWRQGGSEGATQKAYSAVYQACLAVAERLFADPQWCAEGDYGIACAAYERALDEVMEGTRELLAAKTRLKDALIEKSDAREEWDREVKQRA